MTDIKIQYGLREKATGKILGFSVSSNEGGDFCGDTQTSLDGYSDESHWLVDTAESAEWVRHHSTEWYNAGHDTPTHSYEANDLEVVRIKSIVTEKPVSVTIPTFMEWAEDRYSKTEPRHLEYLRSCEKDGEKLHYSIYDLMEYLRKRDNPDT